ncbi:MAG: hypothetical protein KDC80_19415, partial [Saprospiraceae bacterium]|nr:hypothetical protein [Saprospiraceae bacterium]
HLDPGLITQLQNYYDDQDIYTGSKLQEAKALLDECKSTLQDKISEARQDALQEIEGLRDKIIRDELFSNADPTHQQEVRKKLEDLVKEIQAGRFIDTFRSLMTQTQSTIVPELVKKLQKKEDADSETEIEYIPIHKVKVSIGKMRLVTDEDIDTYTTELNKKLKLLLKKNKYTTLN